MLDKILVRSDVRHLIDEILTNSCYQEKKTKNSMNYEMFVSIQQPLFILLDALFKYAILLEEDTYLDEYVMQLEKLMRKIDNYHDISNGVHAILGRFCGLKLEIIDISTKEAKEQILRYVYDKYIVHGYLIHGFSSVYKKSIQEHGFLPDHYQHLYPKFLEINKIFHKYEVNSIMEKQFDEKQVYFTDSFMMGCYYAVNSPMYFYRLLCGNDWMQHRAYKKDAYFRNDYYGCFNNLNRLLKSLKFNEADKRTVIKTCLEEWKLLQKNSNYFSLLLVRRDTLGINYLSDIEEIIENCDSIELSENMSKIMGSKNNKIVVIQKIEVRDLIFLDIPNYQVLADFKNNPITISQPKLESTFYHEPKIVPANSYGKVSLLFVLGSLLITLGVILTIIMISKGI